LVASARRNGSRTHGTPARSSRFCQDVNRVITQTTRSNVTSSERSRVQVSTRHMGQHRATPNRCDEFFNAPLQQPTAEREPWLFGGSQSATQLMLWNSFRTMGPVSRRSTVAPAAPGGAWVDLLAP
jgi:hypothetical protein